MKRSLLSALSAALLAGCFSFDETPFPSNAVPRAAANQKTVAVTGFGATVTEVTPAVTYGTVYVPGCFGSRHFYPGHYETVSATTFSYRERASQAYLDRAREAMEDAGFAIGATSPDRTVEVTFSRVPDDSADALAAFSWELFTLFTCDYAAQAWRAKLRIRDNRTGKLLYSQDYTERFETHVFSPIPLFGISSAPKTTYSYGQNWCLSALTDRAVADAARFLNES